MVNDREALDAMYEIIQRWRTEGGAVTTKDLAAMAGEDYTIHSDKLDKQGRKAKIKHIFGRVVEACGHLWVALGVQDRWILDDTYGRVIVERYDAIKSEFAKKNGWNNTPEKLIYNRVMGFNRAHPDRMVETGKEAQRKYLETGYIPDYIKNNDLK